MATVQGGAYFLVMAGKAAWAARLLRENCDDAALVEEAAERAANFERAASEAWAALGPDQKLREHLFSILRRQRSERRRDASRQLSELRMKFDLGDHSTLPQAISVCAKVGIPLPDWVACAFLTAYFEITNFQAASWDQLFGWPHAKGIHLRAARKRARLKHIVWARTRETQMRGGKSGRDLFEEVADEITTAFPSLHVSPRVCEELYYKCQRDGRFHSLRGLRRLLLGKE